MKKENFEFKKILIKKDGVCLIKYTESKVTDGIHYMTNQTTESTVPVHEDCIRLLDSLKPVIKSVMNLNAPEVIEAIKDCNFDAVQRGALVDTQRKIDESIEITGITVFGMGNNSGVKVSAKYRDDANSVIAINSPNIVFCQDKYGFEESVEEIVDSIKDEVYKYIAEGKMSKDNQVSLKFDDPEEPEDEE